jgi:NAD(P)-dependent dehydrogenase (short-subunit alcohol dehydrogenase family)
MRKRFQGDVAIVTGAGSGIGRRVAERLAAEGAAVLLASRTPGPGEAAAAAIRAQGGDAWFLATDVTRADDCARLVAAAQERWGGLGLLVNNAGAAEHAPVAELAEAAWEQALAVNLKAVFLASKAAFPLLAGRRGAIVTVASLAGLIAVPTFGAYAAAKAGAIHLTRVLALEGAPLGVRANAVCPTWIDTPMAEAFFAAGRDPAGRRRRLEARIPLGRLGTVDEVAAAVLFLASAEASFITGVALPVDGGVACR